MKKTKLFLSLLTIISICSFLIFDYDLREKTAFSYLDHSDLTYLSFDGITLDGVNDIIEIADQNDVLLSSEHTKKIADEEYRIKYVSLPNLNDIALNLDLENYNHQDGSYYIVPRENSGESSYLNFLNNDDFGYSTLEHFYQINNNQLNAIAVHYNNADDLQNFVNETAEHYNIDPDSLTEGINTLKSDYQSAFTLIEVLFTVLTFVIMVFFGAVFAYYLSTNARKITILRLNGYSKLRIIFNEFKIVGIIFLISVLILPLIFYLIFKDQGFVFFFLSRALLLFVIDALFLLVILLFIIRNNKIAAVIKRKSGTTPFVVLMRCLQFVMVVICIYVLANFLNQADDLERIYKKGEVFAKYGSYLKFDTPASLESQRDELIELSRNAYDIFSDKYNAIYADYNCYTSDVPCLAYDNTYLSLGYAIVNANYINEFAGSLLINENYDNDVFLVYAKDQNDPEVEKTLKSLARRYDLDYKKLRLLKYEEELYLPSFDYELANRENFMINDPLLIVMNDYLKTAIENANPFFSPSFGSSGSLLFEGSDNYRLYSALVTSLPKLKAYLDSDDLKQFAYPYQEELRTAKEYLYIMIAMTLLSLILYLLLEYIINTIFIEDDRKVLSIKRLYGYSYLRVATPYLISSLAIIFAAFLISMMVMGKILGVSYLSMIKAGLIVAAIEIIYINIILAIFINKQIALTLKGE